MRTTTITVPIPVVTLKPFLGSLSYFPIIRLRKNPPVTWKYFTVSWRHLVAGTFFLLGGLAYILIAAFFASQETAIMRIFGNSLAFGANYTCKFCSVKWGIGKKTEVPLLRQISCFSLLGLALTMLTEFFNDGLSLNFIGTQAAMLPFSACGLWTVSKRVFC
jgi:hypothetical protein